MKVVLKVAAVVAALAAAFFVGRMMAPGPPAWLDGDFIVSPTDQNKDGFCDAHIARERMKGRVFVWRRVGGCRPAGGSEFVLRPKSGNQSPLEPDEPRGVDLIIAVADDDATEGTIYEYDLWQVYPDGRQERLFDPEIEIGPPS